MCTAGPEVRGIRVELLAAPGCPNADAARALLADCLAARGLDATVVERVGRYRSPTVLVDGVDVMGAAGSAAGDACRLDVPTRERVLAALARSETVERPVQEAGQHNALEDARWNREMHRAAVAVAN